MRYFRRIRATRSGLARMASRILTMPVAISGDCAASVVSACGSAVSTMVPSGRTKRMESMVWYEFCAVPQHMPLALLATMPPTMQAIRDAGSGPIRRRYRRRTALARPPVIPGCTRRRAPSSSTVIPFQAREMSTRIPSVTAWPDRLVPAALKVQCVPKRRATSNSVTMCSTDVGRTTA